MELVAAKMTGSGNTVTMVCSLLGWRCLKVDDLHQHRVQKLIFFLQFKIIMKNTILSCLFISMHLLGHLETSYFFSQLHRTLKDDVTDVVIYRI